MKKIVLTLAVILGLGSVIQLSAQNVSFGVKADANMSNFLLSDMDNAKSKMNIGASLGGFAKIDFHENFALQPELLFHYKASEMEEKITNIKTDYEYWGAEIPVYALYQKSLANGSRFYAGLGPYVGFGFDATGKTGSIETDLYEKGDDDKSVLNRWDFGIGGLVGYEFKCGVQINAGYKIGLIDNLNANKKDASMNNQMVNLGVGYRF